MNTSLQEIENGDVTYWDPETQGDCSKSQSPGTGTDGIIHLGIAKDSYRGSPRQKHDYNESIRDCNCYADRPKQVCGYTDWRELRALDTDKYATENKAKKNDDLRNQNAQSSSYIVFDGPKEILFKGNSGKLIKGGSEGHGDLTC